MTDGDAVHLAAVLGGDRERALVPGQPALGASVPRGVGPTASAVAASGSESSLHSLAPQTFAELISVASKASLAGDRPPHSPARAGGARRPPRAASWSLASQPPIVA